MDIRRRGVGDQPLDIVLLDLAVAQFDVARRTDDEAGGEPDFGPVEVALEGGAGELDLMATRELAHSRRLDTGDLDANRLPVRGAAGEAVAL